jgi:hypothetical protein
VRVVDDLADGSSAPACERDVGGADVAEADLTRVRGLTSEQLRAAHIDVETTKLPDHLNSGGPSRGSA